MMYSKPPKPSNYMYVCAKQEAESEAAIHAIHQVFNKDKTEWVFLVDASNPRVQPCSWIVKWPYRMSRLCVHPIATLLINAYRDNAQLFIDGETLLSQEGTTEGDSLAMPFYALANHNHSSQQDMKKWRAAWWGVVCWQCYRIWESAVTSYM